MLLNNDSAHQLSVPRCQIQLDIFNPISSFSSYDIRIFWLYIWACENVCVIPIAENQWSSQKGSVCQPRPADALIHINIMVPQVYCLASFIHKKNRKLKFLTLICDEVGAVCKFFYFLHSPCGFLVAFCRCEENCLSCRGPGTSCTQCRGGYNLVGGTCIINATCNNSKHSGFSRAGKFCKTTLLCC